MNVSVVYIDDDVKMKNDAFIDDLEDVVNEVKYFEKPSGGLTYVKQNIDKNIIVVLDWKFNNSTLQGENFLNDLNEISTLIPVIIFTAADIKVLDTTKMFPQPSAAYGACRGVFTLS